MKVTHVKVRVEHCDGSGEVALTLEEFAKLFEMRTVYLRGEAPRKILVPVSQPESEGPR
jgi:hypothetical protein